jgi:hypothetical protein
MANGARYGFARAGRNRLLALELPWRLLLEYIISLFVNLGPVGVDTSSSSFGCVSQACSCWLERRHSWHCASANDGLARETDWSCILTALLFWFADQCRAS